MEQRLQKMKAPMYFAQVLVNTAEEMLGSILMDTQLEGNQVLTLPSCSLFTSCGQGHTETM